MIHVDAQDTTGQTQALHLDRKHHVFKRRLNKNGVPVGGRRKHLLGGTFTEEKHVEEHFGLERKTEVSEDVVDSVDGVNAPSVDDDNYGSGDTDNCGDCYGAGDPDECCDTCDDVRRAYRRKGWTLKPGDDTVVQCKKERERGSDGAMDGEGCSVYGKVVLQAGGGNLHIAPGRSMEDAVGEGGVGGNLGDFLKAALGEYDVSHTVKRLRFGTSFPGSAQQMDGQVREVGDKLAMHQYYIQVVPTTYKFLSGRTVRSNQFSVTEHVRHVEPGSNRGMPGVFFFYEVSPLHVEHEETRDGWMKWATELACVLGGIVGFMKFIDGGVWGGGRGGGLG